MAVLAMACGGTGPGVATSSSSSLDRRLEAARIRLASDPRDGDLHLELARLSSRADRPGAALRHYNEADRRIDLAAGDRRDWARLLAARARERLDAGDGGAIGDLERAARLVGGKRVGDEGLWARAHGAAALAALRSSHRDRRDRATAALERLAKRAPEDPRVALLSPTSAPLAGLGSACAWLANGGAKRAALECYETWTSRGGRVPAHALRYLQLFDWWHGNRERPSGLLLDDLRRAGIDGAAAPAASSAPAPAPERIAHAQARLRRAASDPALADDVNPVVAGPQASWSDEVAPLGTVDPFRIVANADEARRLMAIAAAWRDEPTRADRLADNWIDEAAAVGPRAILVAELFVRLGDPGRGWSWAERAMRSSPEHPRYLMVAASVSVAAGATDRAQQLFIEAAAASGDAGATSLAEARLFWYHGQPLAAVAAARRAAQLSGTGTAVHRSALELAARGLDRLGRHDQATSVRATMPRRPVQPDAPGPADQQPGPADQQPSPADQQPVEDSLGTLLRAALIADDEQAWRMLDRAAALAEAAGHDDLAAAIRAERRTVAPVFGQWLAEP